MWELFFCYSVRSKNRRLEQNKQVSIECGSSNEDLASLFLVFIFAVYVKYIKNQGWALALCKIYVCCSSGLSGPESPSLAV